MIRIKPECVASATQMLLKCGFYAGKLSTNRIYVLDGKAWAVDEEGEVKRSDSSRETDMLLRRVRKSTFRNG